MKSIRDKKRLPDKEKKIIAIAAAVIFWLAVWQVAAALIDNGIFLPSPVSVFSTLCTSFITVEFWRIIWNSFYRIVLGFLAAAVLGICLSVASYKSYIVKSLFSPLISFLNAAPVASFTLMLLILLGSKTNMLSGVIAFMMVLPVIYANMLTGFAHTDKKLLEMADVFGVTRKKRVLYIHISNVMPFFVSGCKVGLGICWKSGVAAEVIGLIKNSIGGQMYYAGQWLHMSEMFAWTFVIIAVSIAFEKLFLYLLKLLQKKIES